MIYKDDWEGAQQRLLAWWQGEVIDRVCIQVTSPRTRAYDPDEPDIPEPDDLIAYWTDIDNVVARSARRIANTYWGGEAFPLFFANVGPDAFAGFLGAELTFLDRQTSWVEPIIDDWGTAPELKIHEDSRWWQIQVEMLRAAKARGDGKWITGIPDTHTGVDAVAALRGTANLSLDLYDNPERVKAAVQQTLAAGRQAYDVFFDIVEADALGSSSGWLPAWGPGRTNVLQCDYTALISPDMVEEFVLDSLVEEISWLDQSVYHLDGPDAARHLDALLSIADLNAIQWVPGAGSPSMIRWIPLLQLIQAAGKSLHLTVWPHEIRTLLEELKPEGLMLQTAVTSELAARDLLDKAAKWTR